MTQTCLESSQIAAIIFGAIFGTIIISIAFIFMAWLIFRQYQLVDKIPLSISSLEIGNKWRYRNQRVNCETVDGGVPKSIAVSTPHQQQKNIRPAAAEEDTEPGKCVLESLHSSRKDENDEHQNRGHKTHLEGSAGCVSSTTPTANVNNTSSRTIITNKCVDISPSAELPAEDIPTMKETCPFDEIKNREPIEDKLELGKVESVDSASSESEKVVDEEFACRNGVSFKPGHCSYYYFEEEIDETRSAEESAEVNTHQQQRGEKNEEVQENEDKKIIKNGQSATGSSVVNDDVEIAIIQHKGYNKEGGGIVVAGSTGCKSNGILTKQQCDTLQANRYRLEKERNELRQMGVI